MENLSNLTYLSQRLNCIDSSRDFKAYVLGGACCYLLLPCIKSDGLWTLLVLPLADDIVRYKSEDYRRNYYQDYRTGALS